MVIGRKNVFGQKRAGPVVTVTLKAAQIWLRCAIVAFSSIIIVFVLTILTEVEERRLLLEKRLRDARTLGRNNLDALPLAAPGPLLVKEPTFAERCTETDHAPATDGQHGPDCVVEVVRDAACLVAKMAT